MNETLLIIIAALLTVLVAVFAFNMIQESRYRNKMRSQFGHADQDALMGSQTQSIRDGQHHATEQTMPLKPSIVNKTPTPPVEESSEEIDLSDLLNDLMDEPKAVPAKGEAPKTQQNVSLSSIGLELPDPKVDSNQAAAELPAPTGSFMSGIRATFNRMLNSISDDPRPELPTKVAEPMEVYDESEQAEASQLLIEFDYLKRSHLPWFDSRVDYMAYVSLREPQELPAVPRLSTRYRFQIIGCTMDGLFQIAEPIPGVQYQAFAIGLQAINRNGLVSERDLRLFGQQVEHFADDMDGEASLDDIHNFLTIAKPMDELCARVDQIIAVHLISNVNILGSELRVSLEKLGFQLMQDGTFGYTNKSGEVQFSAVTLDGSEFTPQLLASQPYKGFSMLFDITHVPHGDQYFEEFIDLATALSQSLHLQLVDDKIEQISPEWLKGVRSFVADKQMEMIQARIPPGGELAQRVFS